MDFPCSFLLWLILWCSSLITIKLPHEITLYNDTNRETKNRKPYIWKWDPQAYDFCGVESWAKFQKEKRKCNTACLDTISCSPSSFMPSTSKKFILICSPSPSLMDYVVKTEPVIPSKKELERIPSRACYGTKLKWMNTVRLVEYIKNPPLLVCFAAEETPL